MMGAMANAADGSAKNALPTETQVDQCLIPPLRIDG